MNTLILKNNALTYTHEVKYMQDLKPIIAKNISALRQSRNMTQLDLAEKLNYSDKAISKWERAESVPDISILKRIADLFNVSLDYLVEAEHKVAPTVTISKERRIKNHAFITSISMLLVWLVQTLIFVIIDIAFPSVTRHWLCFVYAVPCSMIVWLVLNSAWFNSRRNFLIISCMMWSVLASAYLTMLAFGDNSWKLFFLGIPGQLIIFMWSRLRYKTNK